MKRRILAIFLAVLLAVLLCEIHVCCGEGCLFCAQTEQVRRLCACAALCVPVFCAECLLFADGFVLRIRRYISRFTLVDLKIRLTD